MKHKDLPQRWKDKIEEYLIKQGSKYKQLSAYDFSADLNLKITFHDGSYAFFYSSFYWVDAQEKEFAVFTEHCGYHIFNLGEILIETLNWNEEIIKTDDYRTE